MKRTILEAKNLVKKYGDITAVKDVNLAIQEGEILGLLGPNGAGKTTIISMITGLLEPTSGSIAVDGLDLKSDTNAVKAKLGLVPQELALYPTLSARDNLSFFGSIYGLEGVRFYLSQLTPHAHAFFPPNTKSRCKPILRCLDIDQVSCYSCANAGDKESAGHENRLERDLPSVEHALR
jgi:ABC-type sugar transport system ATPase subunit